MMTPATLLCDFYKLSHREQYPAGTEVVYSTWTPRANKYHPTADKVVVFGIQAFVKKYLIEYFDRYFFSRPAEEVVSEYRRMVKFALGVDSPHTGHIEALHAVGYLPLKLRALPEGVSVPLRVPMLTIENTDPRFFWLTNFVETLLSAELWLSSTSATIAREYRELLDTYAAETGDPGFVQFQGHDFSMRGMGCVEAAAASGAGHLLSFVGTDTIPAICYMERYYNADIEKELVGTSIPATEHSVMCAGGDGAAEFSTYKRLITEVYPHGFVSIVSDTWDLWACIENIITPLKADILARNGRVVIRPDSGDPVKIICGDPTLGGLAGKGLIESLWDIFGGAVNDKGYKVLDSHIGAIYGDSITLGRCEQICQQLKAKGFASTNMVYGIGSYTYQHNTRDSFGFALKSTMCVIDGEQKQIFKNPATDDGTKKSNTGVVAVVHSPAGLFCVDGLLFGHKVDDLMRDVFLDGALLVDDTLADVRARMLVKYQEEQPLKTDWNFLPKEQFVTTINGHTLGLGLQPGVDLPGVWNIFCLIAGDLAPFLGTNEDPVVASHWLAAAIGASYQYMPGDIEPVGQKAVRMSPGEFLDAVKDFKLLIPRMIMGEEIWEQRTAAALAEFKKHNSAVVIPGNFSRKRCDA